MCPKYITKYYMWEICIYTRWEKNHVKNGCISQWNRYLLSGELCNESESASLFSIWFLPFTPPAGLQKELCHKLDTENPYNRIQRTVKYQNEKDKIR